MKTKYILILIFLIAFQNNDFAQGIVNDGAVITISTGTHVVIENGDYLNQTNSSNGAIDLDGTLYVAGNFTNNAANNVFINSDADGTVVFNGTGTQTISSNSADMSNFIDFEGVTVNSFSITELSAGSAATVNGALTVNGTFTSKTPANDGASGSIITNAAIGGAGDVNLERYFKVGNRWMYISVPIANQLSTPLIDTPYPGYVNPNFYTYDETFDGDDPVNTDYSNWDDFTGMWQNVPTATGLTVGNGYFWNAYNASDVNITFSSSTPSDIHTGDLVVDVTYTDNDNNGASAPSFGEYYDGWNVVGNPFPSAINWELLTKTTSMDNTVYFWDGDNQNYIYQIHGIDDQLQGTSQIINTTGASKNIPAYQSFVVHLTPSSPQNSGGINDDNDITTESFTILNSARLHSNQVMHKADKQEIEFEYLKLRTENKGHFDETLIRFIENTHQGFNGKEDAFKMFPNNDEISMIYSLTSETAGYPLSINTLPLSSINTVVPLGFKTGESGTYTISVSEFNFDAGTDVKLIDTELNSEIILEEGTEYSFNFTGNDNRTRFYLFCSPQGSGIEDNIDNENYSLLNNSNVWSNNNQIFITIGSYEYINANVQVVDITGRTVIDTKISGAYNIINVPGASGAYIVRLRTNDGQFRTDKVYIDK